MRKILIKQFMWLSRSCRRVGPRTAGRNTGEARRGSRPLCDTRAPGRSRPRSPPPTARLTPRPRRRSQSLSGPSRRQLWCESRSPMRPEGMYFGLSEKWDGPCCPAAHSGGGHRAACRGIGEPLPQRQTGERNEQT